MSQKNSKVGFKDIDSKSLSEINNILHEDDITPVSNKEINFETEVYSGLKLFNFEYDELPKLLDPIFPKVGLASLVGSSDTGKSTFLRQLALSIALGIDDFVGYTISPKNNKVIFISTEDDPASTSISIKKPIKQLIKDNNADIQSLNNIKFIFEVETNPKSPKNIFTKLDKDISKTPVDLIVVDAFTDIFSGDINSSTKVREFLNQFSIIAKKHNCLVLFLHHTGKKTHKFSASKDNVLGSQAFEAKMRVLIELKQFPNDETLRTLTITKGNYISSQIKKFTKILKFDEDSLLFSYTGKKVLSDSIASLAYTNPKKDEILEIIKKLHKEKKSIRIITSELKKLGHQIGKSTVANYINEIKAKEPIKTKIEIEPEPTNSDKSEFTL